jgi:hypothetical protein
MKDYPTREMIGNFLSVVFGVVAAIIIGVGLSFFCLLIGLFDDIIVGLISLVTVLAMASFIGGYTTAKNSTRKDKLHVIITTLVSVILFLEENGFGFTKFSFEECLLSADIIVFTLLGGWIAIKHKKSIASDTPASQTDTAEQ